VFSLPHLPVLAVLAFEVLAEATDLVGEWLRGGRPHEEPAHPADAEGGGLLFDQASLQEELAELLQRGLKIAHCTFRGTTGMSRAVAVVGAATDRLVGG
jgi:hypothetical protein